MWNQAIQISVVWDCVVDELLMAKSSPNEQKIVKSASDVARQSLSGECRIRPSKSLLFGTVQLTNSECLVRSSPKPLADCQGLWKLITGALVSALVVQLELTSSPAASSEERFATSRFFSTLHVPEKRAKKLACLIMPLLHLVFTLYGMIQSILTLSCGLLTPISLSVCLLVCFCN